MVISLGIGTIFFFDMRLTDNTRRGLVDKGWILGRNLASNVVEPLLVGDDLSLQKLVEESQHTDKEVRYIYVCNHEGRVVSHTFETGFPGSLLNLTFVQNGVSKPTTFYSKTLKSERGKIQHMIVPIEGGQLGRLHIGLTEEYLEQTIASTFRLIILVTLISLVSGILCIFFIVSRITRPIVVLKEAAKSISEGHFGQEIPLVDQGEKELATLARSFNKMSKSIKDYFTELEDSQARIEREKNRFKSVLEGMVEGVIYIDARHRYAYINASAQRIWKIKASDYLGRPVIPFHAGVEKEEIQALEKKMQHTASEGDKKRYAVDGVTIDAMYSPVRDDEGSYLGFVETTLDVTDELQFRAHMLHTEKMAVVGELAAGLAHEINSPLDGVMESVKIISRNPDKPEKAQKFLPLVSEGLERIATIVRRLLTFSGQHVKARKSVLVASVIERSIAFVEHRAEKGGVEITTHLDPEATRVYADSEGLSQVFINLINNGIDSVDGEGSITVTTATKDSFVEVVFEDDGAGIPRDIQSKVFLPFFSTKGAGKGTGLGLSVSKNIIEEHDGKIYFESIPGRGTRFFVLVPRGDRTAPKAKDISNDGGVRRTT
jgi:signal transduction histidine kinase